MNSVVLSIATTLVLASGALAADEPVEENEVAPHEARGLESPQPRKPLHHALWPLRVLLFPPRVVLMAVWVPPRETLVFADRTHAIERVENLVYWDDAHTVGLLPTVSYDSDFGPQAGAKFFHDNLLGHDDELSIEAAYGGRVIQSYDVELEAGNLGGSIVWLEARGRYERDPKLFFAGIGVRPGALEARYSQDRALGVLGGGVGLGPDQELKVGAVSTVNDRSFGPSLAKVRPLDPSIETRYDTGQLVGFDSGVTTFGFDGVARADLRREHGILATGPYLEAFGGAVITDLGSPFWRYGGQVDLSAPLFGTTRILGLNTFLEAADGEPGDVPFSELPRLGGRDRLRGYREEQFRDNRAFGATLSYRYPVHENIEAQLFVDVGTVAGDYATLFDGDDWLGGYGGGLVAGTDSDVVLRLDASYGDGFHFFVSTDFARVFSDRSSQL